MDKKNKQSIQAKVEPLADVISARRFFMPRHQRPYDWKPEHVEWLLNDLLSAVENDRPHHFLGNIMLVPSPDNRWAVSDGQQRITTFLLICANLCRLFHESGDTDGVQKTLHMLFNTIPLHNHTFEDAQKMQLTLRVDPLAHDRTNFETLITGHAVKKNGKLVSAWKVINKFFAEPKFQDKNMRRKFLDFLLTKILVARIDFADAMDSINVFETQNTRGKSLEQIQLACTYFYLCLQKDEDSSERLYQQIGKVRSSLRSDEDAFFNYARCLGLCRYGHLSSDYFCRDIKDYISKNIDDPADEVRDFGRELSEDYRIGVFQTLARANYHDKRFKELASAAGQTRRRWTISDHVQDLRHYRSVSNAVLFSLFCKYSEVLEISDTKQIKAIAKFVCTSGKLLSSFFQRAAHSFPGAFAPSRYEERVSKLAQKIANGECNSPNDFLAWLKKMDENELIIPDNQYKERMRTLVFPKKGGVTTAKYLLSRINEHVDRKNDVSEKKRTMEHILPKGDIYATDWGFSVEEHGLYAHRLGNLTLLSDDENKSDGNTNSSFKKKKKVYCDSSYKITRELCDFEKWDKTSIEQRQAKLAKIAALVWNFDPDKF